MSQPIERASDRPGRSAESATRDLYARDTGDGPAILMLHAFPLNGRMWEPQLEHLSRSFRVIAPDLPGFGLTPPPLSEPTLDGYARSLLRLLDALGVERVAVVGLSMGGYLAFVLAEMLGERLAGLVLADTRATADDESGARRRHELAAKIGSGGIEVAADELLPRLLGATTQRTRPDLVEVVRGIIRENTPRGASAALRAMAARGDSTDLLPRLSCPTLCVVGDEDSITPPEVVRKMSESIRDAQMMTVAGAGHLPNLEQAESFNEALSVFLKDLPKLR